MENTAGSVSAGFKYNVEHLRRADLIGGIVAGSGDVRMIDGVEYVVLSSEEVSNLIPTEGLDYMLGTALTGVTQSSTWYIALFEGNYTPVAGVTAATFPAAATECTAYDEAARVTWTPGAISAGSVSNTASKAVFTMNATKTVYGIAQTSVSTKSATTGVLVSVARFAVAKSVVATDILNVTSTLTATSA